MPRELEHKETYARLQDMEGRIINKFRELSTELTSGKVDELYDVLDNAREQVTEIYNSLRYDEGK